MKMHYREILQMGDMLDNPAAKPMLATFGRERLEKAFRKQMERLRGEIAKGVAPLPPYEALLLERTRLQLEEERPSLREVMNATGIVLHTNLGRAPLAREAVAAVVKAAGYCNLEFDLEKGTRSGRNIHGEGLLLSLLEKWVPGRRLGALVVNNNAAALTLLCKTWGGEGVYLSRGEMAEIGDGFRLEGLITTAGGSLVEVGATNRTEPEDYTRAFAGKMAGEGILLKVHVGNYRVVGFVRTPGIKELAALAPRPRLVVDLGSGALLEETAALFCEEISVGQALREGADYICFSGDKLLGGPQCGIIVGHRKGIAALKANPLYRALRPCKLTLAALEATLGLYRDSKMAQREIPVLRSLTLEGQKLLRRCHRLRKLCIHLEHWLILEVEESSRPVGGGSAPGEVLPGVVLAITPKEGNLEGLRQALRRGEPSVVALIREGRLLLEVSTLEDDQLPKVVAALERAVSLEKVVKE